MEKSRVISILLGYRPPLSNEQIDAIAEEIAKASHAELKDAVEKAFTLRPKRRPT